MLHSEMNPTPWTQKIVSGLSSELGDTTTIKQEFLGGQLANDEHFDDEYERLALTHKNTIPAVVITNGTNAFAFMRKYGEDLFPAVPILFCSMDRPEPTLLKQCDKCTGLPLTLSVSDTVDLIFELRPNTRIVVGIMDGTPTSKALRKAMETAMAPYMERAQLIFPGHEPGDDTGLDMAALATVASSIPGSGAVLFLGFQEDSAGMPVDEGHAVTLLSERSAAPVFVLTDTWIENGVLGGLVATGEAQGRAIAHLIRRIQSGEMTQEMLPQSTPPKLVVDATVLARFGISTEQLPQQADTLIMHQPERPNEPDSILSTNVAAGTMGLLAFFGLLYILRRVYRP